MFNKIILPKVTLLLVPIMLSSTFAQPGENRKIQAIPAVDSKLSQDSHSSLTIGSIFIHPLSNPNQTGLLDLLVKEAFARNGLKVTIIHHPSERSISNANEGIDDGDIARIGRLNRLYPNLIQVPEKLIDMDFVAFTKDINIKTKSWESLNPYSVGIITGWKILEENTTGVSILTKVKNPELLFRLVQEDRADIVLYDRIQGLELIKKLGFNEIQALEPPLAVREMFLYLNKKHQKLAPKIDKAIVGMKKDGAYKRIFDKFMSEYSYHGETAQ